MSQLTIIDQPKEFFAPVSAGLLDELIEQYGKSRVKIDHVAAMCASDFGNVLHYFLEGNKDRHNSMSPDRLFDPTGAIKALNSAYWSKAMNLTDIYSSMPEKRRGEWYDSIKNMTCPEFTAETVKVTMGELLNKRMDFLAERVDGIFRALSGEHVTNSPAGFGKRMIMAYVLSEYCGNGGRSQCGHINDLRAVIGKFMGRDGEMHYNTSRRLIESLKANYGQWLTIDGGSVKIRLYKKGTAHMEVHSDMAWRLNMILAHLYPMAIPAEFRTKPKKKAKEFVMMQRPLPFSVLDILAESRTRRNEKVISLTYREKAERQFAWDEARKILAGIGGVESSLGEFEFDYCPNEIIDEIVNSGCIPDQKTHQYYQTPESIAKIAVEMAEIGDNDKCLEPSAGQGGLADYMPKGRTTCIELSALHCKILEAKGHPVTHGDFLKVANSLGKFDRIIMNPPFEGGRYKMHIEAASGLFRDGGRLVAILPATMRNKYQLPGFDVTWSHEFANEFAGTSISVTIMCAVKL